MRIDYRDGKTYLDQVPYLEKILKRFGMADAKAAQTLLPTGYKPEPFDGTATVALWSQYQQVIGSLLYLMLGTRPDLAFAVEVPNDAFMALRFFEYFHGSFQRTHKRVDEKTSR